MGLKKICLKYLESNDFNALDCLLEKETPDNPEIWNYWGIAKAKLNDAHGANYCFSKAMEFEGIDLSVFLNFFTSSFPIGKGKETLPFLERLIPGLDQERIDNFIIPNLIKAMLSGDLNLYEMPTTLYHHFLNGEEALDYIMNHFEETKSLFNNVFSNTEERELTINQALSMDEGRRLGLIRFTAALAHVYQADLADLNAEVLTPANSEFENVIYQTSKMLYVLINNYNIKGATQEQMIKEVLPDENFFGFLKCLAPLVASQRFQVNPMDNREIDIEDTEAECNLMRILDFSNCSTLEKVESHAKKIATELINQWKIKTPKGEHRFLALEFYLHIPKILEDSSVHCRTEQLSNAKFYLHTKCKPPRWTPPIFNRHGMDITCGNVEKNIYGGILIRHISGHENKDGSGLALRVLIRGDEGFKPLKKGSTEAKWTDNEKEFFYEINNEGIFDGDIKLVYAPIDELNIESTERVGIENTSHSHLKLRFKVNYK